MRNVIGMPSHRVFLAPAADKQLGWSRRAIREC